MTIHTVTTTTEVLSLSAQGSHAIVIGGSITGLLAARVLSDHFNHVTIIERDHLPEGADYRKGVPQGRHVHVLLGRGQQIMEALFPGLDAELEALGAPKVQWGAGTATLLANGKWLPKYESDNFIRTCSRNLLESVIRRRMKANPGVRFLEGYQVAGLLCTPDQTTVTGVRVQAFGAARDTITDTERLDADFVVDASGRMSKTPEWLQAMGYAAPKETVVNSFLGYATRWYEKPANAPTKWDWVVVWSIPARLLRGGMIYPTEDNRWVVTLAGVNKDYPPTDEDGFTEFMRSLQSPVLYEAVKDAKPVSSIYGYQRTQNQWRHYEKLPRFPERFVVMGDAVCGFNPIYGQGMTTGALGAMELDKCLRAAHGDLMGVSRRFQGRLAKIISVVWMMATGEDYRYPGTEGKPPTWVNRLMHRYIDRMFEVMYTSPGMVETFTEVMHMLKPPSALFAPSILWRVLRGPGKVAAQADAKRETNQMPAVQA